MIIFSDGYCVLWKAKIYPEEEDGITVAAGEYDTQGDVVKILVATGECSAQGCAPMNGNT